MESSPSLGKLTEALVAAQAEIGHATKDSKNPHYKSSYASLTSVLDTAIPVLCKHGLALVQGAGYDGGMVTVTTRLIHTSGEWISTTAGTTPAKNDPQGYGSAVTYLRRYGALALCGIGTEDDDGNAASNPQEQRRGPAKPSAPAAPSGNLIALRNEAQSLLNQCAAAGITSPGIQAFEISIPSAGIETLQTGIEKLKSKLNTKGQN